MKIKIAILEQQGESVLVEWRDGLGPHRAFVPRSILEGTEAELDLLEQGVPYGETWELLPLGEVGAERVAQSLREHGIWTREQARKSLPQVRAALQRAYASDLKRLLDAIRE